MPGRTSPGTVSVGSAAESASDFGARYSRAWRTTSFSTAWDLIRSHAVLNDVVRQARLYLAPKSLADSAALPTLTVPGEVRPGIYRLAGGPTGRPLTPAAGSADARRRPGRMA